MKIAIGYLFYRVFGPMFQFESAVSILMLSLVLLVFVFIVGFLYSLISQKFGSVK